MQKKIKAYKVYKDPYILVLGDKEAENNTVSVNIRGNNNQLHDIPLEKFIAICRKMNKEYTLDLVTEM